MTCIINVRHTSVCSSQDSFNRPKELHCFVMLHVMNILIYSNFMV